MVLDNYKRLWNQNIIAFHKKIGFRPFDANLNIFILQTKSEIIVISIYIDNFLLTANNMQAFNNLKENLFKKYDINDLGEVKTIIGWQITRNLARKTLKVS